MPEGGGGGGGGGGYNIPVSLSIADSFAAPQQTSAGTTFNFSSPGSHGDEFYGELSSVNPATATSSAALGDNAKATSTTDQGPVTSGTGGGGKVNWAMIGIAAGVSLAIAVGVYLYARRR